MLATTGTLPAGSDIFFEVEWDGMRLLADVADGRVRLTDRGGRDVTALFPELGGLTRLAPDVLLDGEVVLLDGGVPSFAALTDRMHEPVDPRAAQARPVTYMVFDVLRLYGVPLLERPMGERRATLERLDLDVVANLSLSPLYTDGAALLDVTRQRGMAGVVAKRRGGTYRPGERSPDWVVTPHRRTMACAVGGWRPARGVADRVGSLLLGLPDGPGLRFVGAVDVAHAGPVVQRVLQGRLAATAVPAFTAGLSRAQAAGARWCEPTTVVEVAHGGRGPGGRLRDPALRGIRDDLHPTDLPPEVPDDAPDPVG
ncbi:DNA ligase [Pseudonocardia lacus]|uniref:ATP-dependent DNA ligase n=1 Tax=Pseudonocardia lacus TaxID=2835865 RepID=UPI001BDC591F|nr:DNA ligase [Pseudonocardia lacus]